MFKTGDLVYIEENYWYYLTSDGVMNFRKTGRSQLRGVVIRKRNDGRYDVEIEDGVSLGFSNAIRGQNVVIEKSLKLCSDQKQIYIKLKELIKDV